MSTLGLRLPLELRAGLTRRRFSAAAMVVDKSSEASYRSGGKKLGSVAAGGYVVEGISIGGHETCVMIPSLKIAFDIGRCPQRAISQDFLFISHSHMDHIGGIALYIATRGLYSMKPPTIVVPSTIKPTVEKLLDVYRELDQAELRVNLIGLDVGEEYQIGKNHVVKPFKTYHVIPSQGYVVYLVKQKLKAEYEGLPGERIRELRLSGVEVTKTVKSTEVAFTGDTTVDFILDPNNVDALNAKLLIIEATFLDDATSVEHAREYGHVHLSELAPLSDKLKNEAILFIHFSARYHERDIAAALNGLPEELKGRVQALTHGFP